MVLKMKNMNIESNNTYKEKSIIISNDNNLYKKLANNADQIVWIHEIPVDFSHHFLEINNYTLEKLGYTTNHISDLKLKDILNKDNQKKYLDIINNCQIDENSEKDITCQGINSIEHKVRAKFIKLKYDNKDAVMIIGRLAEIDTDSSKSLFHSRIVETTDAAVIGIDTEGKIVLWNNGAIETFGFNSDEILGFSILKLISKENLHEFKKLFDKVKRGEKVYRTESYGKKKTGEKIYISITLSAFNGSDGKICGASIIARNITDRKNVEDQLRSSKQQLRMVAKHIEKAREMERKKIAVEVHDELGQALTALTLDLAWLLKKISNQDSEIVDKIKSMYDLIDNTAERVSSIASELRPTVLDHFGFVSAVEWQAEEFKKRSDIQIEVISEKENIEFGENRSIMLLRVLQEILTNILRHSQASKVIVKIKDAFNRVILEVDDNGKGISDDEINNTSSYGILGINERVMAYDGTFRIKGEKGKGTSIQIIIPKLEKKG